MEPHVVSAPNAHLGRTTQRCRHCPRSAGRSGVAARPAAGPACSQHQQHLCQQHRLSGTCWMLSLVLLIAACQPKPAFLRQARPRHTMGVPQSTTDPQSSGGTWSQSPPAAQPNSRATSAAGQGVVPGPTSPADPHQRLLPPAPGAPAAGQMPAVPVPPRSLLHHLPPQ